MADQTIEHLIDELGVDPDHDHDHYPYPDCEVIDDAETVLTPTVTYLMCRECGEPRCEHGEWLARVDIPMFHPFVKRMKQMEPRWRYCTLADGGLSVMTNGEDAVFVLDLLMNSYIATNPIDNDFLDAGLESAATYMFDNGDGTFSHISFRQMFKEFADRLLNI